MKKEFTHKEITNHLFEIDNKGWSLVKNAYSKELIDSVNEELEKVRPVYHKIQRKAGLGDKSLNSTHHTLLSTKKVLELLDPNPTDEILKAYFGGNYILNTMGAAWCDPEGAYNYTQKIHRDIRSYSSSHRLYINGVILREVHENFYLIPRY